MRLERWLYIMGLLAALGGAPVSHAADAQNVAADPALEARVNALSAELRCLVCQNQTIADSHADLAVDLKNQVRDQLKAGRSEKDVIDYMTTRYGDFVLYRPPFKATTALLWGGPALLVLVGAGLFWRSLRASQAVPLAADMSGDETAQAERLLASAPQETPPR